MIVFRLRSIGKMKVCCRSIQQCLMMLITKLIVDKSKLITMCRGKC